MRKDRWKAAGTAAVALLSSLAVVPAESARPQPIAVVVVIEALRHDYPDRVEAPNLKRLAAEGARAGHLIPVFPPNSLPGQATIASGRLPARSGVVNNRFYDRRLGRKFEGRTDEFAAMLQAEPIWTTAARAGIPAGAINWMGTDGTASPLIRSSRLSKNATDEQRVAELIQWISDSGAAAPRLMLVYLEGLDEVSHQRGPEAAETLREVERYDATVGRILDAIRQHRDARSATLFVLGDHGMTAVSRCVFLRALLKAKGIAAVPFASGGSANLYLKAGQQARAVRALLGSETELLKAYLPSELPRQYHYVNPDRVGDLILIGAPGTYFRDLGDQPVGPPKSPGAHGFAPEDPDMQGALFAWGRGVRPGSRWPEVRIVDLYPTLCNLLGIEAADGIDGKPLSGIGVEQPAAAGGAKDSGPD